MNTAPVDWMSDIGVFDAVDWESIGLKNFCHNVENIRLALRLQRGKQIQLDLRLNRRKCRFLVFPTFKSSLRSVVLDAVFFMACNKLLQ